MPESAHNAIQPFRQILAHLPDGVMTVDQDFRITYVNPAFCRMLGYGETDLLGTVIHDHLQDLNVFESCRRELADTGICQDQETTFKHQDGHLLHLSKNVQTLTDDQGHTQIVVSLRDVSQVHRLNQELADTTEKLEHTNQNLSRMVQQRTDHLYEQMALLTGYKNALDLAGMVSKCSPNKTILEVNSALCNRSGYSADELIGQACTFLWSEEAQEQLPNILEKISQDQPWKGLVSMRAKNGASFYLESNIVPILSDNGTLCEIVNISYDVSPLIETTQSLSHRLNYDPLTQLPNRHRLMADCQACQQPTQLVLLNIDNFNEINSIYGHALADELLQSLSQFLQHHLEGYQLTLYKLPIDEFALLVYETWDTQTLADFTQSLLEQISTAEFMIRQQSVRLSLSAGIATSDVTEEAKDRIIAADMALKIAKHQRKPYAIYDPTLNIKQRYENNIVWIKRLISAIEEDRLHPFYQPVVKASNLEVDYYECLVRITDTNGDVYSPFHFLEMAKKLKLYPQLTQRMIEKSMQRFADESCCFSINLSIEDIADPVTNEWIRQKVRQCPFSSRIIFEIVESEGIQNYDVVNRFIQEVKQHGVKIAIDDFGAGYSNFVNIVRLDIDYIKIDGSIIRNIHQDRPSQVITETIIDFASKLGIETVAEFVGDQAVYDHVKRLGLDYLQGYHFGEPKANLRPTSLLR